MYTQMPVKQFRDFVSVDEYNQFGINQNDHETRITQLQSGGGLVANLPVGAVIMYYGNLNSLPSGWRLCDGDNGTPDLRDRFVVAAGGAFSIGTIGGVLSHTHTGGNLDSSGSHSHSMGSFSTGGNSSSRLVNTTAPDPIGVAGGHSHYQSGHSSGGAGSHTHSRPNTGSASGLPPYKALYYIMRTG